MGASGQLGYGMPPASFWAGIDRNPDVIGADMGSVDPGPYYLGSGQPATGEASRRSDLSLLLHGGLRLRRPVIIGSAGTAGSEAHLATTLADMRAVADDSQLSFSLAVIESDLCLDFLHRQLDRGQVVPCGYAPPLTHQDIDRSVRIVAQMGVEPFLRALDTNPDVVLAGRSCDTAIFAAVPLRSGYDRGIATHQAKLIECASQCADPGGRDAIMTELDEDSFVIESLNPNRRCTPRSVAAHSLYEQPDPTIVAEPGGYLDLTECRYESVSSHATRVWGSRWVSSPEIWIKVEGAALAGYRAFTLGGVRDPIALREMEPMLEGVTEQVAQALPPGVSPSDYRLRFLVYGRDGVLGRADPDPATPHEACVVADVVAHSQELAHSVCGVAKQYLLHYFYQGIRATGGNLAFPFGPDVHLGGPVYTFNLYHLVRIDDPLELFPLRTMRVEPASG